jgi:hypothetical protein
MPSIIKHLLLRLLSLYRVLNGTESDEGLGSEAVRVVSGDMPTPVVAADLLLGNSASAGADSASEY